MTTTRIRIITVDDSRIMADGLGKLFKECDKFDYKGNLSSPEECMERLQYDVDNIDIILSDINFPNSEMNGIELAKKIREKYPFLDEKEEINAPRILFMSVEDKAIVNREQGIFGLIPKNESFASMVQMIEMVFKHSATFAPKRNAGEKPPFWLELSPREREISALIWQGKSTKEISIALMPSAEEIEAQRKAILQKCSQSGVKIKKLNDPVLAQMQEEASKNGRFWKKFNKNEKKIITLTIARKSNKEIAFALAPTEQTVTTHRKNILNKIKAAGIQIDKIDDPRMVQLAIEKELCFIAPLVY